MSAEGRVEGRVEGIDLLRGVAVLLVMLRHAWPTPFRGAGIVGVVMFFALSGYLITGVLHTELRARGRVALRRFYLRRSARLVPALLVTVLVALTWTGDLPIQHGSPATFHLWTLATEEQFYLLWPSLLVAGFVRGRLGRLWSLAAGCCLLACAATTYWLRAAPDLAYTLPTSWGVCFIIGATVRLHADTTASGRPGRRLVAAVSLLLLVACVVPWRGHLFTYLVGGPVIAAATSVLLLAADLRLPALAPLVALALTLALAGLSRRYVEEPVLRRVRGAPILTGAPMRPR